MSTPKNPLRDFDSYIVRNVLVAFKTTEDACFTDIDGGVGEVGTIFSGDGCGHPAIVLVNETLNKRLKISYAETTFDYFSPIDPSSTIHTCVIDIAEYAGESFMSLMDSIGVPSLGVSVSHMTFVWRPFFYGVREGSSSVEPITVQPLIFNPIHVASVNNNTDLSEIDSANTTRIFGLATYNSFGQLPQFSTLNQLTITHKDGALHKTIPEPEPSVSDVTFRSIEDGANLPKREKRFEKSKPMVTLKEIIKDALAVELQEQKYAHFAQLQEWLKNIREGRLDKIEKPPIQKKKPGGYLPVDYIMTLDSTFNGYKIDNRNMPFEQPEQSQEEKGIRVFNAVKGEHLLSLITRIMKLSTEYVDGLMKSQPEIFKTSITVIRRCNGKYDVFVKVLKTTSPVNLAGGTDTGPGEGAAQPLTFHINKMFIDGGSSDDAQREVIWHSTKLTSIIQERTMEKVPDTQETKTVYGGEREQISTERVPSLDYFMTMHSGVRNLRSTSLNNGLERADKATEFDIFFLKQHTVHTIRIHGNPHLMSDFNRNPMDVKNETPGKFKYYKFVERHPAYGKLDILISNRQKTDSGSDRDLDSLSTKHYHSENFMHLSQVKSIYSTEAGFYQELTFRRLDKNA